MTTWTPEMEAALERHLIDGLSYSQIGALLKVSRNAAVGKAHRLGITHLCHRRPGRPDLQPKRRAKKSAGKRLLKRASAPAKSAKRAVAPSKPIPMPDFLGLPLHEIEPGQCKWPVNDSSTPDGHLFCGMPHDKAALQPYCDFHMALNVSPRADRRLAMLKGGKRMDNLRNWR